VFLHLIVEKLRLQFFLSFGLRYKLFYKNFGVSNVLCVKVDVSTLQYTSLVNVVNCIFNESSFPNTCHSYNRDQSRDLFGKYLLNYLKHFFLTANQVNYLLRKIDNHNRNIVIGPFSFFERTKVPCVRR